MNLTGAAANGASTIAVMMLSPSWLRRETVAGSGRKLGKAASICQPEAGKEATVIELGGGPAIGPRKSNWRWRRPVPLEIRRRLAGNAFINWRVMSR